MSPQGAVRTARSSWADRVQGYGLCGFPSVLGRGAPGAHSGHPPHLDSWHFLDLLCSLASDLCFASWFLELLLETWRGHLRGSLRYIPGPSVLVGRVDS